MNYNVISTFRFEKELKRLVKKYPALKDEYANLILSLTKNPDIGTFIGNNCYKIRLTIKSKRKGKSGGARVITYLFLANEIVYLLTLYDKAEKSDLKPNELKDMIDGLELDNI